MSFVYIQGPERVSDLERALGSGGAVALDCEAAGFHRYSDRLCLVQVTTSDGTDYVLDPLTTDLADVLRGPLEDPDVEVLMHGADYDLRLLDRDLDIQLRGLFDTQAAGALLGEPSLGLAALLERHVGVRLEKKYQRADWARRPLPEDMLEYAASDTRHLHQLSSHMRTALAEAGRFEWAREEFGLLEEIRWGEETDGDVVTRVKGARDLTPREVTALREALAWRDGIAQARDKAPFRVVQDGTLLEVAIRRPTTTAQLADMKGMNPRLAREEGKDLLGRLVRVESLPEAELEGYPRPPRNGRGRPTPEVEERADRLKQVRNGRAEALGLDRGTLLPNATVLEVARLTPSDRDGLEAVPGMKRWQAAAVGDDLLRALGNHGLGPTN